MNATKCSLKIISAGKCEINKLVQDVRHGNIIICSPYSWSTSQNPFFAYFLMTVCAVSFYFLNAVLCTNPQHSEVKQDTRSATMLSSAPAW